MSQDDFTIGDTVPFPGGTGEILAVEELAERKLIKLKTQKEEVRVYPTNLPWL